MQRLRTLSRRLSILITLTLLCGSLPPMHSTATALTLSNPPVSHTPSANHTQAIQHNLYLPFIAHATPTDGPGAVEVVLPVGNGGSIATADGSIRASFATHAVTQTLRVRLVPLEKPPIELPDLATGGPSFVLTAQNVGTSASVTRFPHAVQVIPATTATPASDVVTPSITIAVHYTPADVWGLDLRTLALYTRETPDQPWQRLPTAVYQDQSLMVAEVDHLSEFVPLARLAAVSPGQANKRLALDPDDDVGHAIWLDGSHVSELPYNLRLAEEVKQRLQTNGCAVDVLITRTSTTQTTVPRSTRAQDITNFNSDIAVTLAFNTLTGLPWGGPFDGGPVGWARPGNSEDDALVSEFYGRITEYTTRTARRSVQHVVRPDLPLYSVFASLPVSTYAHMEVLFLDHRVDQDVIRTGFSAIADAAYAAVRTRIESQGGQCLIAGPGGTLVPPPLPPPPSAAQLQRWRDLGFQYYQSYGMDPVSFSTRNHILQNHLFRIPARGGLDIDFTLTYNAQDMRNDLLGYGWTTPFNARAQHYNDDSISIVLQDGRTYHYEWNGSGYTPPAGVYDTLEPSQNGWLWTTQNHERSLVFEETVTGLGILREMRDRRGNTLHFDYDLSGQDAWKTAQIVPRPPLTSIRDDAGRVIAITPDSAGRISKITLPAPDSRQFDLTYDQQGDLIAITDANTPVRGTRRYQYDERHRITHEWDAEDIFFLENQYDDRDRVIKQWDANRVESSLEYDPTNRITTFTDNLDFIYRYQYDDLNRVTKEITPIPQTRTTDYNADYTVRRTVDEGDNETFIAMILTETSLSDSIR